MGGVFTHRLGVNSGAGGAPAYGLHEYWRVFITDNYGDAVVGLAEVDFLDGAGSDIATTGGTVLFSTQNVTSVAANAFDGNTATDWLSTSSTNQHIGYHYPTGVGVEQVTIRTTDTTSGVARAPQNGKLQYSDDGSAWSDAFSFLVNLPVRAQTRTFPEAAPAAGYHRAWRLFCIDNNGDGTSIHIDELEFRATASGADQTANVGANGNSSGYVNHSSQASASFSGYFAFDNSVGGSNFWRTSGVTNQWVRFTFPDAVKIEEMSIRSPANTTVNRNPRDMLLQYSDDGTTWTTQKTFASQTGWAINETRVLAAI